MAIAARPWHRGCVVDHLLAGKRVSYQWSAVERLGRAVQVQPMRSKL